MPCFLTIKCQKHNGPNTKQGQKAFRNWFWDNIQLQDDILPQFVHSNTCFDNLNNTTTLCTKQPYTLENNSTFHQTPDPISCVSSPIHRISPGRRFVFLLAKQCPGHIFLPKANSFSFSIDSFASRLLPFGRLVTTLTPGIKESPVKR